MKKIEERHNKNKEMSKKFIANKISTEREKYEISHEKFLLMKKIEEELQKEKAFKKYEGYVSYNIYNLLNVIFYYLFI